MANRPALITEADAKRLNKAAHAAGYERITFAFFPDGHFEFTAEIVKKQGSASLAENEWDDVLE